MRIHQLLFIGIFCLHSTVMGFNLECKHSSGWWHVVKFFNCCTVTNNKAKAIGSEITSVNNEVEPTTMDGLLFWDQIVKHFPKGTDKFFPKLRGLHIVGCKLESISQADLKPFTQLEALSLNDNLIVTLDSDLFAFNPLLVTITFADNPIEHVGKDLFTPLIYDFWPCFYHCKCINYSAYSMPTVPLGPTEKRILIEKLKIKCPHPNDGINVE